MRLLGGFLLLAALLLCGCGAGDGLPIREWTFLTDAGDSAITLPAHIDGRLARDRPYTLRTVVALDGSMRGHDLTLVIPRFLARVQLRADGTELPPLDEELHSYRGLGPHIWHLPASPKSSLLLELTVANTWTQSGWFDTVPRLTTDPTGGRAFVLQRTFNSVTTACALGVVLVAGYLYLAIFLGDRRRTEFGWFALTGLAGSAYSVFQSGVLAHVLGPFETVMAAIGVGTGVVAEIHFTAAFFRLPRPSRLWDLAWLAVMATALASVGYFTNTRIGGIATVALAVPAIFSQAVLLVRLARRRERPRDLFSVLGGWALLAVVGIPDFAAWLGLGEVLGGTRTACLGIFVIGLLQTATVSRAHMRSLREAETLNEELQRQVAARSRQLAEALGRLGAETGDRALAPDEVVEGRYRVVRVLGAGGGGTVYLVERVSDRAPFAMKIVRDNDSLAIARLAREAQLAAEVKHPSVIAVIDVDIAASGFLYVVMEYVPGVTLREHREHFGDLAWAVPVLAQIADALAAIHGKGIVHRDLKPANILLLVQHDGSPLAKVTDFGIARAEHASRVTDRPPAPSEESRPLETARDAGPRLTQTGVLMGTPLYMAPEAITGARDITAAADLFAFGVIAYELLVGRLPFRESPALVQLEGVSVAPAPPVLTQREGCPADIARMVDLCLSFDPEGRPTARDVARVLAREELADSRPRSTAGGR